MIIKYGTVTQARSPLDSLNFNKVQYEYDLQVYWSVGTSIPARACVRGDPYGSRDDYRDAPLRVGARVLVWFSTDLLRDGIILTCLRNSPTVVDASEGVFDRQRFNHVEDLVDQYGNWSKTLDQGDLIALNLAYIRMDNTVGENFTIDRKSHDFIINGGADWTMTMGGNFNANITGDTNWQTQNFMLNAQQATSIQTQQFTLQCQTLMATIQASGTINAASLAFVTSGDTGFTAGGTLSLGSTSASYHVALAENVLARLQALEAAFNQFVGQYDAHVHPIPGIGTTEQPTPQVSSYTPPTAPLGSAKVKVTG